MKLVSSKSTEAFLAGERIARLSVITLVAIGIALIIIGYWTQSLVVTADGIDSISDSMVSLIVWVGLHFSRRRPDARFTLDTTKSRGWEHCLYSLELSGQLAS